MPVPSAETTYLFRHALLRDAAYALQLPTERSALHLLAARLTIDLYDHASAAEAMDYMAEEIVRHLGVEHVASAADWVLQQRRRFTEKAAAYAGSQYRGSDAVRLWRKLANICDLDQQAQALYRAGCAARELSVGAEFAEQVLREALEVADRHNEQVGVLIRATLGFVLRQGVKLDEGKRLLEEALAQSRARQDTAGEALSLQYLSSVYRDAGQYDQGMALSEQAVRLHRATGNRRGEGLALGDMAMSANNSGRSYKEAVDLLQQALILLREVGDVRAEGIYTGLLATVFTNMDQLAEAEPLYAKSIAIHRQVGNVRGRSIDLRNCTSLLVKKGQLREAEAMLDEAFQVRGEIPGVWILDAMHRQRALLLWALGRFDEAVAAAELATSYARPTGNRRELALCQLTLTQCLLKAGRVDDARVAWEQVAAAIDGGPGAEANKSFLQDMHKACAAAGIEPFA